MGAGESANSSNGEGVDMSAQKSSLRARKTVAFGDKNALVSQCLCQSEVGQIHTALYFSSHAGRARLYDALDGRALPDGRVTLRP